MMMMITVLGAYNTFTSAQLYSSLEQARQSMWNQRPIPMWHCNHITAVRQSLVITTDVSDDLLKLKSWLIGWLTDDDRCVRAQVCNWPMTSLQVGDLPISGTASEVGGMVSATSSRNTVRDSRIVTPETETVKHLAQLVGCWCCSNFITHFPHMIDFYVGLDK